MAIPEQRNADARATALCLLTQESRRAQWTPTPSRPEPDAVCVEFLTQTRDGLVQSILLRPRKPIVIGRNPARCTYVISDDIVVSGVHCKIWVISSERGIIVSCEDVSTNGILLNGYRVHKTSVILMDGDVVQIPNSQTFKCIHVWKGPPVKKQHLFDQSYSPPQGGNVSWAQVHQYAVMPHCLGRGTYGTVHLAMDPQAQRQVACKTIVVKKSKSLSKRDRAKGKRHKDILDEVWKEVRILMGLRHPNINRVYDAYYDAENTFMHIFLQLCTGGDLFSYIIDCGGQLREGEAQYIMYQLFQALLYLHDRSIAHRDLKPENILLYTPGPYPRIQIADFGLARRKSYETTLNVCGTVPFLPPEAIQALDDKTIGYTGMPADCWSAGVIMFILLAGYHPFDSPFWSSETWRSAMGSGSEFDPDRTTHKRLASVDFTKYRIIFREIEFNETWDSMDDAKFLVQKLLHPDPLHRYTVSSAISSTWIQRDLRELEIAYRRLAF